MSLQTAARLRQTGSLTEALQGRSVVRQQDVSPPLSKPRLLLIAFQDLQNTNAKSTLTIQHCLNAYTNTTVHVQC